MKYRKKVPIEAVQWLGQPLYGLEVWWNKFLVIPTLEGDLKAVVGDWIATGPKGEHWPIRADIFAETYEPVDERVPTADEIKENLIGASAKLIEAQDEIITALKAERDALKEQVMTLEKKLHNKAIIDMREDISTIREANCGNPETGDLTDDMLWSIYGKLDYSGVLEQVICLIDEFESPKSDINQMIQGD